MTTDCTDACMVGVEPPIANADVLLGEVDPRAVNPFLLPPVAQPASATSGSVPGLTHNSNLDIMRSVGVGVGVTAFFAFVVAFFVYSKKAKRGWERFSQRGAYAVAARKSSVGGAGSGSGSVAGTVASTPSPSDGDAATIDITDALMMDGATIVEPRTSSLSATASPADIKRRSSRLNSTMSVVAPSPLRQCVTLLKTPSTRTAASSDDGDRLSTASSSGDATPADGAATRTSSISEAAGVTGSSLPQHDGMARMLDVEDNENDYDSGDLSSRAYLRTPTPDHMLSPNAPPPTANVSPVATDLLGTMAASTSAINNSTAILLGNTFRNALRIASGISEDGREIHVRSASVASSATGTSESDGRLALGDDNEHEDEREDHDESTRRTMTTSTATMNQRSPGSESLLSHALGSESSSAGSRTTGGSSPLLSGLAWPEVEQHQSRTLRDDGDTSDGESV